MDKSFDAAAARDHVIAAVRAGLDASGRADIVLERDWLTIIDGQSDHIEAVLLVPIGRNLALPLGSHNDDEAPETVLDRFAEDLIKALPNVERAKWSLRRYAADMRRAAEMAIESAQADGAEITLACIGLRPTYACDMTQSSWKEAAGHVLARVLVHGLNHHLNPEMIEHYIEQSKDVAHELANTVEQQIELRGKLNALGAQGATVAIDVVTLRVLLEHDLGIDTISEVVRVGHKNIDLTMRDGATGHLYIVSSYGTVSCNFHSRADGAFRWCLNRLELAADPAWGADATLVGRDLAELAGDELFQGLTVASVRRCATDLVELGIDAPTRLFNADTCQLLRQAA